MGKKKLGLTLSGGGAKGAYQVGIIKYLAEMNIQPDMLSGTSIGALNASVISAEKDINKAYESLDFIWQELAQVSPVKLDGKKVITTASVLLNLLPMAKLNPIIKGISWAKFLLDKGKDIYSTFSDDYKNSKNYKSNLEARDSGVMSSEPLVNLLVEYASVAKLRIGLPLYIGVYESDGSGMDIINYMRQSVFGTDTKGSEFWHVQALQESLIHDAIMASAALPYLFQARAIEGKLYRDGGMGGAFEQQGNTPVKPLVDNGCDYIIVSLLDDGSAFDRHKYPETTIIEVRPKDNISESITDMVAFTPEKIDIWTKQGYEDAKRCIGDVLNTMNKINYSAKTVNARDKVLSQLDADDFHI